MARRNPLNDIKKYFGRIDKTIKEAKNKNIMKAMAKQAIVLVVKRTRLGYGVDRNMAKRSRLKALSPSYTKFRKDFRSLSSTTRPKKSNLTLTGDMLKSMDIISLKDGKVIIGPTGFNRYGESNQDIASYNAKRGRTFNRLSINEYNQLRRFYRKTFGDLLKKRKLLK